jgi:ring-1,2-phenylacetyl-CoA epoxidase subunit PaaD
VSVLARARTIASGVLDPELPPLTIADLGILREVRETEGGIEVLITPTYSGCPAHAAIMLDLELALAKAGLANVRIRTVLSPAWTTDWIGAAGLAKLKAIGIAPPVAGPRAVACPRCGSPETERLAQFGSTACKALWRCLACREPFDHFKCH